MKLSSTQSLGLLLIIIGVGTGIASVAMASIQIVKYWELEKNLLESPNITTPSGYYVRGYESTSTWERKTGWMPFAAGTLDQTIEYLETQTHANVTLDHETTSSWYFISTRTQTIYGDPTPPVPPQPEEEDDIPDVPDPIIIPDPLPILDGEDWLTIPGVSPGPDQSEKALVLSGLLVGIGVILVTLGPAMTLGRKLTRIR